MRISLLLTLVVFSFSTIFSCLDANAGELECLETLKSSKGNPFVTEESTSEGFPIFENFTPSEAKEAILMELSGLDKVVQAVVDSKEPPSFENTVLPLETFKGGSKWAGAYLSVVNNVDRTSEVAQIYKEVMNAYYEIDHRIYTHQKLFLRVKLVYESLEKGNYPEDQKLLIENMYQEFLDNGIHLDPESQKRALAIQKRLKDLANIFSRNLMEYASSQVIHLTNKKDLAGLTKDEIERLKDEATKRDLKGYVVSLNGGVVSPILTRAKNRNLRERVWRLAVGQGYKGRKNNKKIVLEISRLRLEYAQMMGHKNYADLAMKDKMAGSAENVLSFADDLLVKVLPVIREKRKDLVEFIKKETGQSHVMPWDLSYWENVKKKAELNFDPSKVKDYFVFEEAIPKLMDLVSRFMNVKMIPRKDLKAYNEESFVYEVRRKGQTMGFIHYDLFTREAKSPGAWHMSFGSTYINEFGERELPVGMISANFSRPVKGQPTKLGLDQIRTILHETGHGLHNVLSMVRYESLSGTRVPRDIVEGPSQFMENLLSQDELVKELSAHYKTGKPIPQSYLDAMRELKKDGIYERYLQSLYAIYLDFAWHQMEEIPAGLDVASFEEEITKDLVLSPVVKSRQFVKSTSFGHIFVNGYASGYYSYLWSNIIDADAFEYFKENGLFNEKLADLWIDEFLSKGQSVNLDEAYRNFRGSAPDVDAMLRRDGLLERSQ